MLLNGNEAIHSLYSISVGIRQVDKWRDGLVGIILKCPKEGSQNFNEVSYGWKISLFTNFLMLFPMNQSVVCLLFTFILMHIITVKILYT